jgi:hypothetical protein
MPIYGYLGVRDVRWFSLDRVFNSDHCVKEFLFYHQKESDMNDDGLNPVTPWAQMMR